MSTTSAAIAAVDTEQKAMAKAEVIRRKLAVRERPLFSELPRAIARRFVE
jgi:hypothetical protein